MLAKQNAAVDGLMNVIPLIAFTKWAPAKPWIAQKASSTMGNELLIIVSILLD
jgi:cyanate permease